MINRRTLTAALAAAVVIFVVPSFARAQGPILPRIDVKRPAPGLPAFADLIISGGLKLRTAPFVLGDRIKIPVQLRIENRGNAAAGAFRIAFFRLVDTPPGAMEEVEFDGEKLFPSIRPTRDGGGEILQAKNGKVALDDPFMGIGTPGVTGPAEVDAVAPVLVTDVAVARNRQGKSRRV